MGSDQKPTRLRWVVEELAPHLVCKLAQHGSPPHPKNLADHCFCGQSRLYVRKAVSAFPPEVTRRWWANFETWRGGDQPVSQKHLARRELWPTRLNLRCRRQDFHFPPRDGARRGGDCADAGLGRRLGPKSGFCWSPVRWGIGNTTFACAQLRRLFAAAGRRTDWTGEEPAWMTTTAARKTDVRCTWIGVA